MGIPGGTIRVLIHGASGRIGQALLAMASEYPAGRVIAAIAGRTGFPAQGVPAFAGAASSGIPRFDVAIDFSHPSALPGIAALCTANGAALVSGTTGLGAVEEEALAETAKQVPVLWSSNFSLGAAALHLLSGQAAKMLRDWDCEIAEIHHRHKRDAPSGTAVTLAAAVAVAQRRRPGWVDRIAASANGNPHERGSIGVAALRGGSVVGEHRVGFYGGGERVELVHVAEDRSIFARGAWHAALRLVKKPPGRHLFFELLQARRSKTQPR